MIVICEKCGKETKKKPSEIKEHTFCSLKCMGEWRRNNSEFGEKLQNRKAKSRMLNRYVIEDNETKIIIDENNIAIIDTDDLEKIKKFTWRMAKNGYAITQIRESVNKTKRLAMHRLINNTPNGMFTDHKNRKKLDNRKCNLRNCTTSQNAMNKVLNRENKTSRVKGVDFQERDKLWRARICKNGKRKDLGYYKTEKEAIKARLEAEKEVFGEFSIYSEIESEVNDESTICI